MSQALRLILFGDGQWAADSLTQLRGGPHPVVAVVVRRQPSDGSLAETAQRLGIPVLQPAAANAPDFIAQVRALQPDLGVSVSYNQIFRRPILDAAPLGFVNFHAGKLPRYRGRNVINWAIINGEREIGVTAHLVDEAIDNGGILLQRTVPIGWTDGYGDVLHRVVRLIPSMVEATVALMAEGGVTPRPQVGPATYFGRRRSGDEWLDWSASSERLHNLVRGITRPGPGSQTVLDGEVVTIWRAFWDPSCPRYIATPGEVVGCEPGAGVRVKTGDSTLLVQEVQRSGGAPAIPTWRIGTRLGVDVGTLMRAFLDRADAATGGWGSER